MGGEPLRNLGTLPKAHLHVHLDGAMRNDTLSEECVSRGIEPPTIPSDSTYPSFAAFMATIGACHEVLRSPAGLGRVMHEVVEDAAADGAIWIEVSVWPGLVNADRNLEPAPVENGSTSVRSYLAA